MPLVDADDSGSFENMRRNGSESHGESFSLLQASFKSRWHGESLNLVLVCL